MTLIEALIANESAEDTSEAKQLISEMHERAIEGEDPEELLLEYGLEPDYVMDILDY